MVRTNTDAGSPLVDWPLRTFFGIRAKGKVFYGDYSLGDVEIKNRNWWPFAKRNIVYIDNKGKKTIYETDYRTDLDVIIEIEDHGLFSRALNKARSKAA